ncbi:MAG: site-specific integrase, partial [Chloroflexi bacterium]|nr:site-specific integrase [Chloroflexota bacterium]
RRKKSFTIRGNKAEAQRQLRERLVALDKGLPVDTSKETVGEFLDRWLDTYVKLNTSPKTYYDYAGMIRRYLKPALGQIPLTKLSPQAIQGLHAGMYEKGLSSRSVQYVHKTLKQSLKHAVKWGMVGRNVCDLVDSPRPRRKEMQCLNLSDIHRLLDATAGSTYGHIFHLAIFTGVRRGELLALRWSDVDLQSKTLSVNQALSSITGKGVIAGDPKTRNSRRLVSLPPSAIGLIRSLKARQMEQYEAAGLAWDESRFVFCNSDGGPMSPDTITHAFKRIASKLGLSKVRFHDLRHSHATLMLKAGVHPKIVSERLGHASINITLDTYTHILPGLQEAAALAFEESLAVRSAENPLNGADDRRVPKMSPIMDFQGLHAVS